MLCGTLRSCALSERGEQLRSLANLLYDVALTKEDAAADVLCQIKGGGGCGARMS